MGETISDRVAALESEVRTNIKGRLDGFSQELKILLVEINVISEWISQKFGVELIDKASHFFKHIHDFDEIEDLTDTLSLLKKGGGKLRNRKAKLKTRLRKKNNFSDSDETYEEPEDEIEAFFDPPECVLETDGEEEALEKEEIKPKRKRGRKKKDPKKVTRKRSKRSSASLDAENEPEEPELGDENGEAAEGEGDGEGDDPDSTGKRKKKYIWKPATQEMQCEECGKILKGDSSLRCHMLMHADLRPHQCQEPGCGKRFRNKTKLGQHIKIHGSEKSEICNFCGRGFLRKKDLVIHERTHTGEKPFACPQCPKSFNIKEHLTIHKRVHTGERPYTCEVCSKAFSQANSLRIHKKIHLKQASDYVPVVRKPRGPRKVKSAATQEDNWPHLKNEDPVDATITTNSLSNHALVDQQTHSPTSSVQSTSAAPSSLNLKHDKASSYHHLAHEDHSIQHQQQHHPMAHITPEQQHSLLVQSFFQQTQQGLDPTQQTWNFATVSSSGNSLQDERGGPSHSPLPQAHNLALHHSHPLSGFKLQQTYPPPQQNLGNMIRTHSNSHVQTGPFGIPQFHDPNSNFRHFPH